MASAVLNSRSSQAGGAEVDAVDRPVVQAGDPERAAVAHALGQHVPRVLAGGAGCPGRCGPCPCSAGASARPTPLGDSPAHRSGCRPMRRSRPRRPGGTRGRHGLAAGAAHGIDHRRSDAVVAGVDGEPVVAGEADQHQPGPLRGGHGQRRRRAHRHQRGEPGGPRLLHHLEAGPARHPQRPSPSAGSAPSSRRRPTTLSTALWRPMSSRTTSTSPVGVDRGRGMAAAGGGEQLLAVGHGPGDVGQHPGVEGPRRRRQRLQPLDQVVDGLDAADPAGRGGGGQPRRRRAGARPPVLDRDDVEAGVDRGAGGAVADAGTGRRPAAPRRSTSRPPARSRGRACAWWWRPACRRGGSRAAPPPAPSRAGDGRRVPS